MSRYRLALLVLSLAALGLVSGCHAAAGPQIGYTLDRGMSYGWEAGGGAGFVRGNVGQVIRPTKSTKPDDSAGDEWVTYLAAEPWFYVGGTLGYAYSNLDAHGLAVGAWGGVAAPFGSIGGEPSDIEFRCNGGKCRPVVAIAGGVRYINGEVELYLTPKLGVLQTIEFF